ncbi:MAG: hypothetical protein IPF51_12275 [Dehalococcoidia bacterium]|uniref:hypothetical protein n=1 Tax=Candidatus Amarobacter glycogenicus TaxID=3140699 RepID=UPI003134AEB1|nr:hypothetical protein [Dehalococcoidia bacterium]
MDLRALRNRKRTPEPAEPEDAPRQRGLRGFFRRWMDAVQEDDDRRTPRDSSRRRSGGDWD